MPFYQHNNSLLSNLFKIFDSNRKHELIFHNPSFYFLLSEKRCHLKSSHCCFLFVYLYVTSSQVIMQALFVKEKALLFAAPLPSRNSINRRKYTGIHLIHLITQAANIFHVMAGKKNRRPFCL